MEFSLQEQAFIELNKLLKLLNIAESGGYANQMIINGEVYLNNKVETRKRCKLKPGDTVSISNTEITIYIKH